MMVILLIVAVVAVVFLIGEAVALFTATPIKPRPPFSCGDDEVCYCDESENCLRRMYESKQD